MPDSSGVFPKVLVPEIGIVSVTTRPRMDDSQGKVQTALSPFSISYLTDKLARLADHKLFNAASKKANT